MAWEWDRTYARRVGEFWVVLLILANFAVTLGGWAWLASRVRRRGAAGGPVMDVFDEVWHPSAHQSRTVIEIQDERAVPRPSPGDKKR